MTLAELRGRIAAVRHTLHTASKDEGDAAELALYREVLKEIAHGSAINTRLWASDALKTRSAQGPIGSRRQITPGLDTGEETWRK